MLVINDSLYGNRVPVQIGTLHIDMMLDLASEEEKKRLNRQADELAWLKTYVWLACTLMVQGFIQY